MSFHVPETARIRRGRLASSPDYGNNGAFMLRINGGACFVIASDTGGWEHVSVSRKDRCPTWDEMAEVAALFWDKEDTVIQFRPPSSDYVNFHTYCLHWWRPTHGALPSPPSWMVGPRAQVRTATELPHEDRRGLDEELQSGYLALIGVHRECAGSYPPGAQRQWHLLRAAVLRDDLQEWQDLYGKVIDVDRMDILEEPHE